MKSALYDSDTNNHKLRKIQNIKTLNFCCDELLHEINNNAVNKISIISVNLEILNVVHLTVFIGFSRSTKEGRAIFGRRHSTKFFFKTQNTKIIYLTRINNLLQESKRLEIIFLYI